MRKAIYVAISVLFLGVNPVLAGNRPPLAFTCNAKMGDLLGQVQLFASGHSRFVFKMKGQDKAHACWLKAQFVQDQRQSDPGSLVAEYLRSENCTPALEAAARKDIPTTMRLVVANSLNAKAHATITAEGIPGQYICNITNDRLNLVSTFAVYPEEAESPDRGIASDSTTSTSVFPDFEIWWEEQSTEK